MIDAPELVYYTAPPNSGVYVDYNRLYLVRGRGWSGVFSSSSKRASIRKVTEDFLHEKTNTMNFQDLSRYIIGEDIANEIVDAAKDIYPIKKIEIRKSEVTFLIEALFELVSFPSVTTTILAATVKPSVVLIFVMISILSRA